MAKNASKSTKTPSSSASSKTNKPLSTGKIVLKIKTSETLRRSTRTKKAVTKRKPHKKVVKFDAKKPKKPPTAFFYFLEDFRKEFQEQNPDVKSMRDIGKACGEKWKTMTYEEKVKYYDIATEKRAEFDRAMAEYIRRKESGEDEETEEGSEFDE